MQIIISENGNLYNQWTTGGNMTPTTWPNCGQYISCPSCGDWIYWACGADLDKEPGLPPRRTSDNWNIQIGKGGDN